MGSHPDKMGYRVWRCLRCRERGRKRVYEVKYKGGNKHFREHLKDEHHIDVATLSDAASQAEAHSNARLDLNGFNDDIRRTKRPRADSSKLEADSLDARKLRALYIT